MKFVVLIGKDKNNGYQASIHGLGTKDLVLRAFELEGIFNQAQESLKSHLLDCIKDGKPLPTPKRMDDYRGDIEKNNLIPSFVPIDVVRFYGKTMRYNIPVKLMKLIDIIAQKRGISRSTLLANAVIESIRDISREA